MTWRGRSAVAAVAAIGLLATTSVAAAQEPWTGFRVINMAHQGGDHEGPSNTMYAYKRALKLGIDMLEVDFHSTADDQLVVMHDATVDRTTEGSGSVYDMSLSEVRKLDAAYDFVPGAGTKTGLPASSYPFRGVRTGKRRPPPGYKRSDFRIPTLEEVLNAFPQVPINLEIKGTADTDFASFRHNAELLAALLNRIGRSEGIIVVSFNDAATSRFHELAPQIDLAPGAAGVAAFKAASVPPGEGMVAIQPPITVNGVQVTDADFVQRAHAQDLAVQVWLSNDTEDEATYERLLDWNVDGIMAAQPARLEALLCAQGVARPSRPDDWPGGPHCNHRRVSIACSVRAVGASRVGGRGRVRLTLRRRDEFDGRCAGRVRLRARGGRAGVARFDFGRKPPKEGGLHKRVVRLRLSRAARALLEDGALRVLASARPYDAFAARTKLLLRD